MEITFWEKEIWTLTFEFEPREFLVATGAILKLGDVCVFGAYEPTPQLISALISVGAVPRTHLPEFFTTFDLNYAEHPNGSAFEYRIAENAFSDLLAFDSATLSQSDIPSFYDHFIAYRPGDPKLPLISFHDAACGGSLYLSPSYPEDTIQIFASSLHAAYHKVQNPTWA